MWRRAWGGRCQILTFVAGAQAQLDEQEQQRPHVHIGNWTDAVQHVKRRRQEKFQRIPTFQRPASCSRNKGGFFWESLPWGESDPGGCASSCGSTVTRSRLPVRETGTMKDSPVPPSMILQDSCIVSDPHARPPQTQAMERNTCC